MTFAFVCQENNQYLLRLFSPGEKKKHLPKASSIELYHASGLAELELICPLLWLLNAFVEVLSQNNKN